MAVYESVGMTFLCIACHCEVIGSTWIVLYVTVLTVRDSAGSRWQCWQYMTVRDSTGSTWQCLTAYNYVYGVISFPKPLMFTLQTACKIWPISQWQYEAMRLCMIVYDGVRRCVLLRLTVFPCLGLPSQRRFLVLSSTICVLRVF
jgi:hypothetical protein